MTTHTQRSWLTANTLLEGYPIYLRRPDVRGAEFESLRPEYPELLVVERKLERVKRNSLPETAYNNTLAELDVVLTEPFQNELSGLIALIEAFAGKRTLLEFSSL